MSRPQSLARLAVLASLLVATPGCVHSESEPSSGEDESTAGGSGRSDPLAGLGDGRSRPEATDYVLDYNGPPLLVVPVGASAVEIRVSELPSGSRLSVDEVEQTSGSVSTLSLKLDLPEGETGGTESRSVRFDGEFERLEIRVSTWEIGIEYLLPPEARLAAVFER